MKFVFALILIVLGIIESPAQEIINYDLFTGVGIYSNGDKVVVLRKFNEGDRSMFFVVNPNSLVTKIISIDSLLVFPSTWNNILVVFSKTTFIKAIHHAEYLDNYLQDAGYRKFRESQKGIDLTIDLCPSKRPLDRIVFNDIIESMSKVESPVPIAISITGRWINSHIKDLNWLDSLVKRRKLTITWVNHTYNHYIKKNSPLGMNFMLAPGTDIKSEILNTEVDLLKRKIVPSIFFRFPGLVSNQLVYNQILQFGLIPIGSDAWLAKGQKPGNGSIVLIHANGNEMIGVKEFIELLKSKQNEVLSRHWELFDLRESLIEDESE